MTPNEKAISLTSKMAAYVPFYSEKDNTREAKELALIAVDELINEASSNITTIRFSGCNVNNKEYWKSVKSEIEKL